MFSATCSGFSPCWAPARSRSSRVMSCASCRSFGSAHPQLAHIRLTSVCWRPLVHGGRTPQPARLTPGRRPRFTAGVRGRGTRKNALTARERRSDPAGRLFQGASLRRPAREPATPQNTGGAGPGFHPKQSSSADLEVPDAGSPKVDLRPSEAIAAWRPRGVGGRSRAQLRSRRQLTTETLTRTPR